MLPQTTAPFQPASAPKATKDAAAKIISQLKRRKSKWDTASAGICEARPKKNAAGAFGATAPSAAPIAICV